MRELPADIEQMMTESPHLQTVWWGNRATFEIIEEFSESAIRTLELVVVFVILLKNGWIRPGPLEFLIFFGLWCWWALSVVYFEWHRWRKEIYLVARDITSNSAKGVFFKFTGSHVLDKRPFTYDDDTITASWPLISWKQTKAQWWWLKLTGEDMISVHLDNPARNITYIGGNRISQRFVKALKRVKGEIQIPRPTQVDDNVAMIYAMLEVFRNGIGSRGEVRERIFGNDHN